MAIGGGYDTNAFVAEFYDQFPPHRDRPDVPFYIDAARSAKGRVLEVCCGTGRILMPIARDGIAITGVDLSPHMLDICRRKLKGESEAVRSRVQLVEADMRGFELTERFGLAMIPFRSFQHLVEVNDQCACLRTIYRHLHENGRIIIDLFNPSIQLLAAENTGDEKDGGPEFQLYDGKTVRRMVRFVEKNLSAQVNRMEFIYYVTHANGRQERLVHAFPMRYLFRYEIEHLLYRCGFRLTDVYSDFKRSAFAGEHPRELIVVGEKM